jgi:hypothetical protein
MAVQNLQCSSSSSSRRERQVLVPVLVLLLAVRLQVVLTRMPTCHPRCVRA